MSSNTKWLPNLVEGVSIWKLARDLNEDKFMGGRLLVPETEGSDSLPTSIQWNLEGLLPLAEAMPPGHAARRIAHIQKIAIAAVHPPSDSSMAGK